MVPSLSHHQQMRRLVMRIEPHEAAAAVPLPVRTRDLILDAIAPVPAQSEVGHLEVHHVLLRMMRVEIDYDEDDIGEIRRGLGIAKDVRIVGLVEAQIVVELQGWILAAGLVYPGDKVPYVSRGIPVAWLYFVFFGVEVLLAAFAERRVLAQFEAAVNAVD